MVELCLRYGTSANLDAYVPRYSCSHLVNPADILLV